MSFNRLLAALLSWSVVASLGAATAPCAYLENSQILRVHLPAGETFTLQRCADLPNSFLGPLSWQAQAEGSTIVLVSTNANALLQKGYRFNAGRLTHQLQEGRTVRIPAAATPFVGDAGALISAVTPDAFAPMWADGSRLRLWFVNPNTAGALLALIVLWGFAVFFAARGRWWGWLALALAIAGFGPLWATQSRSALLAWGLGMFLQLIFLLHARRLRFRPGLVLAVVGVLTLAAVAYLLMHPDFCARILTEGSDDTSRLPIWAYAPKMIFDSANGWGAGNSGVAYINWYQPLMRFFTRRGLVSSHLKWLVEFGWTFRVIYVTAWVWLLWRLIKIAWNQGRVLAISVWAAWAVALQFNHVGVAWEAWLLLVGALVWEFKQRTDVNWRKLLVSLFTALGVALLIIAGVGVAAKFTPGVAIAAHGQTVWINGKDPSVWVVGDHAVLDGGYWGLSGKDIRRFYKEHPLADALGYVDELEAVPMGRPLRRLTLAGAQGEKLLKLLKASPARVPEAESYLFLSPPFTMKEIPESFAKTHTVQIWRGEFTQNPKKATKSLGETLKPGCGLYFPDWVEGAIYE